MVGCFIIFFQIKKSTLFRCYLHSTHDFKNKNLRKDMEEKTNEGRIYAKMRTWERFKEEKRRDKSISNS